MTAVDPKRPPSICTDSMAKLATACPILASQVEEALAAVDEVELAQRILALEIINCTFGDDHDVGYIYFKRPPYPVPSVHKQAAEIADTLGYGSEQDFYIDIDHEGNVYGIEYIFRRDISDLLRKFWANK